VSPLPPLPPPPLGAAAALLFPVVNPLYCNTVTQQPFIQRIRSRDPTKISTKAPPGGMLFKKLSLKHCYKSFYLLQRALKNLDTVDIIGIADFFSTSLCLVALKLGRSEQASIDLFNLNTSIQCPPSAVMFLPSRYYMCYTNEQISSDSYG
jgi:hypothetical protein